MKMGTDTRGSVVAGGMAKKSDKRDGGGLHFKGLGEVRVRVQASFYCVRDHDWQRDDHD